MCPAPKKLATNTPRLNKLEKFFIPLILVSLDRTGCVDQIERGQDANALADHDFCTRNRIGRCGFKLPY